jgi:predicted transcriptional regulator
MKKSHTFRFDSKKVKRWQKFALKDNRSLTKFIEVAVTDYVDRIEKYIQVLKD